MAKLVIVLLIAMFFETAGILYLSKGLKEVKGPEKITLRSIRNVIWQVISNKEVLFGVFLQAIFFSGLLFLMANADVSFIWPMTSMSFVFATIAARFYLHEQVAPLRWVGVILIMCGAALITYTEKVKERPVRAAQAMLHPGATQK